MKPQVLHRIPCTPPLAKRPRAALAEAVFEIVAVMLAFRCPHGRIVAMSIQTAFHLGLAPVLQLLLPGRAQLVLDAHPDPELRSRIDALASRNTEGELTADERAEYEGYVRANKFVAVLRREARLMVEGAR